MAAQESSSDSSVKHVGLKLHYSRASRNLLVGDLSDSEGDEEKIPSRANSDDILHAKDYRHESRTILPSKSSSQTNQRAISPSEKATTRLPSGKLHGRDEPACQDDEDRSEGEEDTSNDVSTLTNTLHKSSQDALTISTDPPDLVVQAPREEASDKSLSPPTSSDKSPDRSPSTDYSENDVFPVTDWVSPEAQAIAEKVSSKTIEESRFPSRTIISDTALIKDPSRLSKKMSATSTTEISSRQSSTFSLGNSPGSSPLFSPTTSATAGFPPKADTATKPSRGSNFAFQMLEEKLASLTDESDAEGPVMSWINKLKKKVSTPSGQGGVGSPVGSASPVDSASSKGPGLDSVALSHLHHKESLPKSHVVTSSADNLRQESVYSTGSNKSNVSFSRSVSVAMFRKDEPQSESDRDSSKDPVHKKKVFKKQRIDEKGSDEMRSTSTQDDIPEEQAEQLKESPTRSSTESSAAKASEESDESDTSSSDVEANPSSTSTWDSWSAAYYDGGSSTGVPHTESSSLHPGSSWGSSTGGESYRDAYSPSDPRASSTGGEYHRDTYSPSDPTATITSSSKQDLSPSFMHHINKLMSLPNISSESRQQLTNILANQEDTHVEGVSATMSSNQIARIVSSVLYNILQEGGISGLHLLSDSVNEAGAQEHEASSVSLETTQESAPGAPDTGISSSTSSSSSACYGRRLPTLSELLCKIEQRELGEERAGVGSLPDLSGLARLLGETTSSMESLQSEDAKTQENISHFVYCLLETMVQQAMIGHQRQDSEESQAMIGHQRQDSQLPAADNVRLNKQLADSRRVGQAMTGQPRRDSEESQLLPRDNVGLHKQAADSRGSIPESHQGPSALLGKMDNQEATDPAYMDKKSWEMRKRALQTRDSMHVSSIHPSQVLKQNLLHKYQVPGDFTSAARSQNVKQSESKQNVKPLEYMQNVKQPEFKRNGKQSEFKQTAKPQEFKQAVNNFTTSTPLRRDNRDKLGDKFRAGVGREETHILRDIDDGERPLDRTRTYSLVRNPSFSPFSDDETETDVRSGIYPRESPPTSQAVSSKDVPGKVQLFEQFNMSTINRMNNSDYSSQDNIQSPWSMLFPKSQKVERAKAPKTNQLQDRFGHMPIPQDTLTGGQDTLGRGQDMPVGGQNMLGRGQDMPVRVQDMPVGGQETLTKRQLADSTDDEDIDYYLRHREEILRDAVKHSDPILPKTLRQFPDTTDKPKEATKPSSSLPVTSYPRKEVDITDIYLQSMGLKSPAFRKDTPEDMRHPPEEVRQGHEALYQKSSRDETNRQTNVLPSFTGDMTSNGKYFPFSLSPLTGDYPADVTRDHHAGSVDDYHAAVLKAGGAGAITSRDASPSPDTVLGSTKRSTAGSTSDLRSFLVEKEVIESKLRKLQMENSGLQTENKLMKEKFNRAQARCQYLEAQLQSTQQEAVSLREQHEEDLTSTERKARDRGEKDKHDLEGQIIRLTRNIEMVKAENALLEKQLVAASKMPSQSSIMADTSPLIDSYKLQVQALKEELQKSRDLRQDCERQRREEAERHKEASIQIIKLTELKALLQQQLENAGGGTVTEKQVLSLERRLKITEDRLHRERSDRAGKLSEVEEKLINENAKLQVSDKESKRQLQRERDKNRNLSEKYRDTRDELETLQMELAETPLILDKNTPYQSKMSTIRSILGSKKHAEEVKHILEQIKQQENLGQGQENDIIWLLWHQREEVTKQLKEWELALNDLKIDHNNIKDGIKNLRSSQAAIETWEVKHREALEDSSAEKDSLLNTFRQQIQSLTKDKHEAIARAKNLEDINAAVTAECDALRSNDRIPGGQVASQSSDSHMWQAKMESVRMELVSVQGELQEAMRSEQAATSQLHSLVTQLAARDQALDEALLTIQRLEASSQTNGQGEEWRLQKVDLLQAELTASEKEIETWREKCRGLEREKTDLEERVDSMNKRLMRSKPTPDTSVTESFVESDKLSLETELHEKDRQVHHLTVSYNEVENELQRSKQHLLVEQERNTELTQQLSQLQTQLRQKTRIMEKMANAEADYQRELQAARENLASVNRDLAQKNQELRMTAVDLEKEKSRSEKFRGDLQHRDQLLSQDIAALVHQGALSSSLASDSSRNARDVLAQAEMKSRLADYEKEILRHENDRGNHVIESLVTENSELHARIQEVKQELIKERAHVCQITTEKSSLEQKCHVVEDERDAAVRQRAHLEQDLSQREAKTQTAISRLEQEAQQASHDYTEKYEHLDAQGKQMAVELSTTRRLLEAREKEIDIMRDSVYRQKQEIASLQRRISVLSEENLVCREDIEKLTTELTRKMKESAVTVETQQLLSSERSKLQIEKHQLEKDFSKSRLEAEHHRTEVTELKHKLEIVEDRQTRTEKQLFEKEAQIVAMETEVKNTNKASTALESDHIETKALAEKLNQGLEAVLFSQGPEHESLYKEKSTSSNLRDELTHALHQLELIRQGHDLQVSNLQSERRTLDMLKEKYQTEEERAYHLEDRIRTHALELETVRGHLADTKTGWEQCKNDKQTLYQDVQDLCRKLADRDETIAGLQEKCSLTVETIQRECGSEKVALTTDKMRLESDLAKARHELEDCRDLLKQKELQLEVYYRTSQDLQEETRAKGDLEMEVTRLQATLAQANLKLSGLQSENSRLQDSYKQTLASLDESRHSNLSLKEQLREQKDETSREIKELRMSSTNQTHRLDLEKGELQDLYTKTQADLRAAEASLAALIETKQSLQDSNRHYESTVETLKSQVHEEITAKRLVEQRLETVKEQLEDVRTRKAGFDEKNMELQSQLSRMESELSAEREKSRKLRQEISDSQNTSLTAEQQAQALQMHIAELQAEVSSLRSQLETHKQTLAGKNKRLTLELKQQADDFDKERTKLLHEAQQLSSDVEQTRQQVAQKNRENLRLQEEILGLEERVRDTSRQSRQAQDALKGEESSRDVLENRNLELELLLAKLRTKDSDDASFEATRNEVTRMLSELSRRMQTQLEQQKTTDTEARQKDQKKIEELKNKIAAVEAALGQEQALHIVTKSNVTSLEDDNQRLRQQLQIARKRTSGSTNDTDRSKSRLEEINEIIARSQTRAQQLLATGAYGEDALKSLSPNNDYLSPRVPSPSPQRYTPTEPGVNGTTENQYRQHKY